LFTRAATRTFATSISSRFIPGVKKMAWSLVKIQANLVRNSLSLPKVRTKSAGAGVSAGFDEFDNRYQMFLGCVYVGS
jgi:hypothetical protein